MMLIIWGAGGHARVVLDAARASGRFKSVVLIDDDPDKTTPDGKPVVAAEDALRRFRPGTGFVVAIGDNTARARIFTRGQAAGWEPRVVEHPSSVVSASARIGPGSVILPRAVVNAGAEIGADCIVNTAAIVEHDCHVGDHAHISPAAALGGGVTVGRFAHIGLGGVILPRVSIGDRAVVGAGAVVVRHVLAETTVIGIPARTLDRRKPNYAFPHSSLGASHERARADLR